MVTMKQKYFFLIPTVCEEFSQFPTIIKQTPTYLFIYLVI